MRTLGCMYRFSCILAFGVRWVSCRIPLSYPCFGSCDMLLVRLLNWERTVWVVWVCRLWGVLERPFGRCLNYWFDYMLFEMNCKIIFAFIYFLAWISMRGDRLVSLLVFSRRFQRIYPCGAKPFRVSGMLLGSLWKMVLAIGGYLSFFSIVKVYYFAHNYLSFQITDGCILDTDVVFFA